MLGEDHFFGTMDDGAEDATGLAAKFGESGFHLCEKYILFGFGQTLPAHAGDEVGHGEAEEDETKEGGDGGTHRDDPEGGKEREGLGGEAFAGGGDEGRNGIPCGEPAGEAFGASGIHDGGEQHPKLRDDGDAAADVAVESGYWSEREADGESSEQDRSHGDGEKQQAAIDGDLPEDHHGGDEDEPDEKVEYHHVETAEEDGFAGEIDFCEHGLGGVEGIRRALDGIDENLPQECAHHCKGRIWDSRAGDLNDALGVEEYESH